MERYKFGRAMPFAPLYDVELVDEWNTPIALIAIGLGAEDARALIRRQSAQLTAAGKAAG
jgi:hypothetical protein